MLLSREECPQRSCSKWVVKGLALSAGVSYLAPGGPHYCRVHIICSNTPAWRFQVILKTLTSWFRCLIKVGAKDFRIIIIQYFKIKCVIWDRTLNSCFLRAKLLQSLASTCSNMPAWTYLTNDSNTYCWRQDSSICPGFRGRMSEWTLLDIIAK